MSSVNDFRGLDCFDYFAYGIRRLNALIGKYDLYDLIPIVSTFTGIVVLVDGIAQCIGTICGGWELPEPGCYGPNRSYFHNKSIIVACVALLPVIGNIILAVGRYFTDSFQKEKKQALEDIAKGKFDIREASLKLRNDEDVILLYLKKCVKTSEYGLLSVEKWQKLKFIGPWLLINSKEVVLPLVQKNPHAYSDLTHLFSPFATDKEVIEEVLIRRAYMIQFMDPEIRNDFSLMSKIIAQNPRVLDEKCLPPHILERGFKQEKEKALQEIGKGTFFIQNASFRLRKDPETMTAFLKAGGYFLFLEGELEQDETLALLAVQENRHNYRYLPEELQKNVDIALAAVDGILESDPRTYYQPMKKLKIPPDLLSNVEFFKGCTKKDPFLIQYFPKCYQRDMPSLQYALQHGGVSFFKKLPEVMRSDEECALLAVAEWPGVTLHLPKTLQTEKFLSEVIKKNPFAFRYLPPNWKGNLTLANLAVTKNKELWFCVPATVQEKLRKVKNFSEWQVPGEVSPGDCKQTREEEEEAFSLLSSQNQEYVLQHLRKSKSFFDRCRWSDPFLIRFFPEFWEQDLDALNYTMDHAVGSYSYRFFPWVPYDKGMEDKYKEYALTVIRKNPGVAAHLPEALKNEYFPARLVHENPFVFRFLQLEQQKNPEIAAAAALKDRRVLPFVPREIIEEVKKILNNS